MFAKNSTAEIEIKSEQILEPESPPEVEEQDIRSGNFDIMLLKDAHKSGSHILTPQQRAKKLERDKQFYETKIKNESLEEEQRRLDKANELQRKMSEKEKKLMREVENERHKTSDSKRVETRTTRRIIDSGLVVKQELSDDWEEQIESESSDFSGHSKNETKKRQTRKRKVKRKNNLKNEIKNTWKNETPEQKAARLEKMRLYQRKKLENETPEQRERRLAKQRKWNERKVESETAEKRLERIKRQRESTKKKEIQRKVQLLNETLEEREARLARTRAKVKEKGNPRMETQEERELRFEDLKLIDEVMGIKTKPKTEEVPIKFEGGSSEDEEDPFGDLPNATENNNFSCKIPPQNPSHAFKCSKCVRTFEFRSSLIVHELEHRPKVKCKVCRQNVFAENLEEHQKMHQKAKKLSCDFCDEIFSDETSLATHKIQHEVKKEIIEENEELITAGPTILSFTFYCDNCGQKFREKFQLLEHIFRDHCGESKRNCLKCGFTTHCSNLMRIHRRSYKPKHECEICGWDFTMTEFLDVHRYKVHNIKNFSCEFCGKAFGLRMNLRNHQKFNHASLLQPIPKKVPISYSCDLCPRVYHSKSYLVKHMEEKHLMKAQYVCKHCSFTTNCFETSQFHRSRCKKAHCDICGKSFVSNKSLKLHHEAIHENTLKYECELCGMKVKVKKYLYHHKRLHHGDQPSNTRYHCEFCGKQYKMKIQFAAHIKDQHHIQNYVITPEMLVKVDSEVRNNKRRGFEFK